MRRRTLATLGATASLSLAGWAVLAAPPLTPPAAASGLAAFSGCEELRQWYVDAALPLVGPYGFGYPIDVMEEGGMPPNVSMAQRSGSAPDQAVGNGETGTNVQEVGVDEPDVAKTDGEIVVTLNGDGVRDALVTTDVTGSPRELSRVDLPGSVAQGELLLVGDTVVVIANDYGYDYWGDVPPNVRLGAPVPSGNQGSTQVVTVDISDPTVPQVEDSTKFGGSLVSAREYDGTVRLVVSTGTPTLDFVMPEQDRSPTEATRENRAIVRSSSIEDWLPSVDASGDDVPLVECTDVRHPGRQSGLGTISVVTFDAESPDDRSATAVTTAGELVYSSLDRLYVATSTAGWGGPVPAIRAPEVSRRLRTQVHAFALDGADSTYVASGEVPGVVKDRWSFSEYDGHLRVATSLGFASWSPQENAVVVLDERGGDLVEVGRVDGMGIREQIQSVRWFGDLAVLVTFRQVDPLYLVDLSDPEDPRVLGELKIPGFSAYLHPIGDQRLLGLGQNATLQGTTIGAQVGVFDIRDLNDPRRIDSQYFGANSTLTATADPRAFTYLPEERTALTPVQDYMTGRTLLAILEIGPDGTLTRILMGIGGYAGVVRTLPLGDGQVALVVDGRVSKLSV